MTERKVPEALAELAARAQWVAYSRTKVPIDPATGRAASSVDPATWGTLDAAKYLRAQRALPGVGFVLTEHDPYVGIDLDHAVDELGVLEPWAQRIVDALDSYAEWSPSGDGVHIWVRGQIPAAARRAIGDADGRVELYDRGRYFTVTGRHIPGTPTTFEERPAELERLHAWTCARKPDVDGSERPWKTAQFETVDVSEWLADALAAIPAHDYETWVRVGMGIRNEIGDAGFTFWDDWSSRSEKYPGQHRSWRKWGSFPAGDGKVGLGTVVWLAEQHGYTLPEEHRGARPEIHIPESFRGGWDEWIEAQQNPVEGEGESRGLEIVFYDAADLYLDDSPFEPFLIEPAVLGAGDLMLVAGPPKAMKSLVTLDLVRAMCLGREWLGMTPERPLSVACIQFELKADSMRRRLQLATLEHDEIESLRRRFILTGRFAPVLSSELVDALSSSISAGLEDPPDLLVVDPLANLFDGDNENDNAQMMAFARSLFYLRNRINPDAAIILVHHASKRVRDEREAEPFNAIRGSSALRGLYDAALYVERSGPTAIRMWSELRNGPPLGPWDLAFDAGTFRDSLGELPEKIVSLILDAADDGVAWTKGKFIEAHSEDLGVAPRKLGGIIKGMCEDGILGLWRPDAMHDVEAPGPRSDGLLGVPNMLWKGQLPVPID